MANAAATHPGGLYRAMLCARHVDPDAAVFLLKIVRKKGIGHEMEPVKAHAGTPCQVVLQSHQCGCTRASCERAARMSSAARGESECNCREKSPSSPEHRGGLDGPSR